MNKHPIREAANVAEDQIGEYLVAHPEFFERHPGVLARSWNGKLERKA